MKSALIFIALLCGYLQSAATFASTVAAGDTRPPNIILLMADDLGYGDLASYGHPYARTPNLDRLAREGTQFHKFYVAGSVCGPSRAGFFTGRNPYSFSLMPGDHGFDQAKHGHFDRITVMELLKNAGYTVVHIGKWHMGPDRADGTYGIDDIRVIGGGIQQRRGRDESIYSEAIKFVEKNRDKPFYLNVMGVVTHAPVTPQQRLIREAGFSKLAIDRKKFAGSQLQSVFDDIELHGGDINDSMASYLTEVYFLDVFIGELLDKLDELDPAETTIVAFTSDQGPAISRFKKTPVSRKDLTLVGWSGGLRGQKHEEYEGGVRTPFILRWPGQVPGGKINELSHFSALDWLPTISRIAGLPIEPTDFHGEDVLDIWLGSDRSRNQPLFWMNSMKKDNWRLYFRGSSSVALELYDLSTDPGETTNLVKKRPEVVMALARLWTQWQKEIPENTWWKSTSESGGI
jgi:arylsulfatase A-like enzyme